MKKRSLFEVLAVIAIFAIIGLFGMVMVATLNLILNLVGGGDTAYNFLFKVVGPILFLILMGLIFMFSDKIEMIIRKRK